MKNVFICTIIAAVAVIALMAVSIGLYAQEKAHEEPKVSVELIKKERIEENEITLPNGEQRILYASRCDFDSVLGPRRGEGFLKGWYSENGKYVGFADYIGTNTKFTLLNVNKQIIWQKEIELQVVNAYVSNSGQITILFVGFFDDYHIKRVEIRDLNGELITKIEGGAAGGWVVFSASEKFGLLFCFRWNLTNGHG